MRGILSCCPHWMFLWNFEVWVVAGFKNHKSRRPREYRTSLFYFALYIFIAFHLFYWSASSVITSIIFSPTPGRVAWILIGHYWSLVIALGLRIVLFLKLAVFWQLIIIRLFLYFLLIIFIILSYWICIIKRTVLFKIILIHIPTICIALFIKIISTLVTILTSIEDF